ncbi:MAG: aminotransferase class I/II-fold pyridoxal phosphate-dependent enzyme, partial [Pseudomonadota bacterium]
LAERYDFTVFADECYSEIYRTDPPPGALQAAHALGADPNRVIAFHSLSKRSNLAGLRSGFAAGGQGPLGALRKLKAYGGAPCPVPALHAAEAVWRDEEHVKINRALYARKFEIADDLLTSWPTYRSPDAGFFLWIPVRDGEAAARALWRDAGLKALPGAYLSRPDAEGRDPGAAFIRFALVAPVEEVEEGLSRLAHQLSRNAEAWQGDTVGEAPDLLENRTPGAGPVS